MDLLDPSVIKLILVGTLGAVVHAFSHLINYRKNNIPYTWRDFIVYTVFGGFAGIIFGLLAQWVFPQDEIARLFFTGMGAFMGFAGLNALSVWALRKLGVSENFYVSKD